MDIGPVLLAEQLLLLRQVPQTVRGWSVCQPGKRHPVWMCNFPRVLLECFVVCK